jgi:hypothetical protein
VIRVNGDDYWLYGAVDPETNEILHFRLFLTTMKQTRGGFSPSFVDDTGLLMSNFSSMTPITW